MVSSRILHQRLGAARQSVLMSTRNLVLATAVFALTFSIASSIGGIRLCGKQLADMLDLVCYGRGFHWTPRERGGVPHMTKRTAMQYMTSQEGGGDGLLPEVGVVAECCRKSCSISVLESYCAASPSTDNSFTSSSSVAAISTTTTTRPPTTPASTTTQRFPTTTNWFRRPVGPFRVGRFFFVRPVGPAPTRGPSTA